MTQINSYTGIIECHLWIEELLQFDGLQNGAVYVGCSAIAGTHGRRSGTNSFEFSADTQFSMRLSRTGIRSTKHCQTDFQSGEINTHDAINQQQTSLIVTKGNYT